LWASFVITAQADADFSWRALSFLPVLTGIFIVFGKKWSIARNF
jgi:hypothetical protein